MKMRRACIILLSLLSCYALNAAVVGDVRVESTSSRAPMSVLEQIVAHIASTKPGDELKPMTLSEDISKLVKTGRFDDVQVRTPQGSDGKTDVVFVLTPKPVVREILIEGAVEIKSKSLQNHITLETGTVLDENVLAKDREAMLDRYRGAGYYGTTISSIRRNEKDGETDIVFVIKEEKRYKLKQVFFENNTEFELGELRENIVTRREWWRYILRFGNYFNEQNLALDKDKLKHLYATRGYLDFSVTEIRQEPIEDGKWIKITFVLDEGHKYKVGTIDITGNERFSNEELLGHVTTKPGDFYNVDRETFDTDMMKAEYERLGYMDLRFYPIHVKDRENYIVNVNYKVSEGGISNIRNIIITGNEITKDEVVRRELAIAPGDLGDQGKIRSSKSRLMNMGYFENVEILPSSTEEPGLKDLRIELSEKPTGQISLGAGFSSEDSAIAFIEFSETNFDLARLFDWPPKGDGQRLRVRTQVGDDVMNFTISHTEPWLFDKRLELSTEIFWRERYEDEYDQRNVGIGQMLSFPVALQLPLIDKRVPWRMGIGYRAENVKISDVDTHDPDKANEDGDFVKGHILADEEDTYWATRLIWRLSRDSRDAFTYPTKGSKFSIQAEYVTEALGSYESYGRYSIEYTKYMPFVRDMILKLSTNYSSSDGDKAAIFDRYFAGGIGTIRGFERRDVAPVDCYEAPLGGNSMFTGTIELIQPVKNFMYISTFLDAGNVWWNEFDFGSLNYSVGVGVQFKALPISIYYGYPISTDYDHLDGSSGRLHFNVGISY